LLPVWVAAMVAATLAVGPRVSAQQAPSVTLSTADPDCPAPILELFGALSRRLAERDLPGAAALYEVPARAEARLRKTWQRVRRSRGELAADCLIMKAGVREAVALVRYELTIMPATTAHTPAGTPVGKRRAEVCLRLRDGRWRFTADEWEIDALEQRILGLLASPGVETPSAVDVVLELVGGQWQAVRPYWWQGRIVAPGTPLQGRSGRTFHGQTLAAREAYHFLLSAAEGALERREAGTLHVFLQREGQRWLPVDPVWYRALPGQPGMPSAAVERKLRRLRRAVEAGLADPAAHGALAEALMASGREEEGLREFEQAAALDPRGPWRERAAEVRARESSSTREEVLRRYWDAARARDMARRGPPAVPPLPAEWRARQPRQQVRSADFTVRFHGGDPTISGALAGLEEAVRIMSSYFGFRPGPTNVVIFLDEAEYAQYRSGRGERALPQWSSGASDPFGILTYQRPGLRGTLAHEYTHEAIRQASQGKPVPTWLHEGMATLLEGGPANYRDLERQLTDGRRLLDERELTGSWRGFSFEEAITAYVQARSLVEYLIATQGPSVILKILDDVRFGRSFDEAFRRNVRFCGQAVTVGRFVEAWRQHLGTGAGSGEAVRR